MIKRIALLFLLLCGAASAQTTLTLASGGIGISCVSVTASTSTNPGLAGGCISFNLLTSGGLIPSIYTWQVLTTGSPASVTVNFMGSVDGTAWVQIDTTTAAGTRTVSPAAAYRFLGCVPATLSGGSSPTVTCQISVSGATSGTLGGGTVTSVSGTANQVDVATGTTTPVISLDTVATASTLAYATDTGSANAVAITVPSWYPTSATLGETVRFKAAASSTGATTINITPSGGSAYGAVALDKRTTAGVAALGASGDIVAGGMYEAMYDGTEWVLATTSSTVYIGGALTTGGIVTGNANNQAQGTSTLTAAGGVFTKVNNIASTGDGVGVVRAVVTATGQTALISTATLCAAAVCGNATAGQYHVHIDVWGSGTACGTPSPGGVTPTLTWTDENAVAHSAVVIPMSSQTGATTMAVNVTAPTVAFQTALGSEGGSGDMTISTNGTIIQYSTAYAACGAGTGTYNIRLTVVSFNT